MKTTCCRHFILFAICSLACECCSMARPPEYADMLHPARVALTPTSAEARRALAREILANKDMEEVANLGLGLFSDGFSSGGVYTNVWARDFGTLIETAIESRGAAPVREAMLLFFHFQGADGSIPDSYQRGAAGPAGAGYWWSVPSLPGYRAHKETCIPDQEACLVYGFSQYVRITGDTSVLKAQVNGESVLQRLERALEFVAKQRFDKTHGLVWGGTRMDWSDFQPETNQEGLDTCINPKTHPALCAYDSATYIIALNEFLDIVPSNHPTRAKWEALRDTLKTNVMKWLWDSKRNKFRPHVYLDKGSPFPPDFDEDRIFVLVSTAKAMDAGLLSPERVRSCYRDMFNNKRIAGAETIGLINYPPYPKGYFLNGLMDPPFWYTNNTDWTWWGSYTVQALYRQGMIDEAWHELLPIVSRAKREKGFFEFHNIYTRVPRGAGTFRTAAGPTVRAIRLLQEWAKKNQ